MIASKKMKVTGWVISVLVAIFLIGPSALGKFIQWEGRDEMFAQLGFTTELIQKIGVLEIALAVMLLIPRAAFLGAILLTAYLGGATVTHLRVGEPFLFPPLIGVVMWIGLACRRPEIFALATGAPATVAPTPEV